ncbi:MULTISPECIES: capsule biosynthesis protein [unclassified Ruegeria]|uniref:capsule biosynthesis protein n=1 Tax=unclassified Ruegeria TaxID=2625375 RepID=UPI001489195D|nr:MULTISPECIES: capsule biosynthesis protein [unclassified Ruegeria]NOD35314.1 capsule biosynthesis protein [Ruegeria sp. HKCCD7296]NOD49037.1 capsule biosynthesis protein [Ruegeria sp. HKCCD5849]NOD53684.1 capsule biosynthesis protein [Ruegeria sp. HKCCD5851]NOD69560.1 capsule biosynthesis protein [Ruegeria sp. HKCCD7303]NOE32367.1 capsule biosynthesis protein [Ruegeria sp. HKCCD7318]
MTTNPKVRKYSGHRNRPSEGSAEARADAISRIRNATQGQPSVDEAQPGAQLDDIKREGLTGRQLRIARRLAQKHGLAATSDYDAVRLLRQKGIDPFQRTNLLDLAAAKPSAQNENKNAKDKVSIKLPQAVGAEKSNLPGPELSPTERRNLEIGEIQKDIARRRRRKLFALFARLAVFVFLPTFVVGFYFYRIATPMYASDSEFLILQADGGPGSVGGLLAGTQFATTQDSISVQSFLESKEALLLLDQDAGFSDVFKQDWIDPIQRLAPDASLEDAYKLFKRMITIGYDPTEGVIRMEVAAPDPQTSTEFSERLISYAENRVNALSGKKREDQMRDAIQSFESAQEARKQAQEELIELQLQGAVLDPENVIASLRSRITEIEILVQDKELELAALLDNLRPNKAKVDGVEADIARLEKVLEDLNAEMLDASAGENSLARLSVRIQIAQADLAARDMMLQTAMQQMESTRSEANRQVRYLTVSVNPIPSQEPTYPRKFENTILAFLLFAGIYLMISLTASVLREQVSS